MDSDATKLESDAKTRADRDQEVPTLLFAMMVAIAVLPLYASQTMLGPLGGSLHLGPWTTLVTALTLLGYAVGLVGLVPLVDRLPNRSLIIGTLFTQTICLGCAGAAPSPSVFLVASFAVGITASAVQMLVPAAASLAAPGSRGRVVGNVMSGLMLGILLSRPLASLVTGFAGWRGFYWADAALVAVATVLVVPRLPDTRPTEAPPYLALLASMGRLIASEPVLRQRALYQALLMAGFNVFWSSVALVLSRAPLSLSSTHIAVFALAGGGSVIVAPLAGRAGDKGFSTHATTVAHGVTVAAILVAAYAVISGVSRIEAIGLLAVAAFAIDGGVVADQALGRRAINLLAPQSRGRVNGLFTGLFFIGGACGAAVAGPALALWGWPGVCLVDLAFFGTATALHLAGPAGRRTCQV